MNSSVQLKSINEVEYGLISHKHIDCSTEYDSNDSTTKKMIFLKFFDRASHIGDNFNLGQSQQGAEKFSKINQFSVIYKHLCNSINSPEVDHYSKRPTATNI